MTGGTASTKTDVTYQGAPAPVTTEASTAHTRPVHPHTPPDLSHIAAVQKASEDSCSDLQDAFLGDNLGLSESKSGSTMGNRESKAAKGAGREAQFEAKEDAQGGRWLDAPTVDRETAEGGFGVRHRHETQEGQPEFKAAVLLSKEPEVAAAAEKRAEARASEQGGRWLGPGEAPSGAAAWAEQADVKAALAASHDPAFEAQQKKKAEAKHLATGGRWDGDGRL